MAIIKTVVAVSNSQHLLDAYKKVFSHYPDYSLITTRNPNDIDSQVKLASRQAEHINPSIDLLITDLFVQRRRWLDLMREVREKSPHASLIVRLQQLDHPTAQRLRELKEEEKIYGICLVPSAVYEKNGDTLMARVKDLIG